MKIRPEWIRSIQKLCLSFKDGVVPISTHMPKLDPSKVKKAAVLIPICHRHGRASLLYTVRTHSLSTHKGQVAFPGGHTDEGESAIDTALRETYEEIGESVGPIKVIGVCQSIPSITGLLVTPVIGYIENDVGDLTHLEPSLKEVDKVFTRSFRQLVHPDFRVIEKHTKGTKTYELPVFGPEDGDERIWGLTAMITDGVVKNIIAPSLVKEGEGKQPDNTNIRH